MNPKRFSRRGEQGDTAITLVIMIALGLGTTVYYNMDRINTALKSQKITSQKLKAETKNISGLSLATALMTFTGTTPQADDPASLPYIYPDPYFQGGPIGTPRTPPNVATWSFSQMDLHIQSPLAQNLTSEQFAQHIQAGTRPPLKDRSTITFKNPSYDNPANPLLITSYNVEVKSRSYDNQSVVSKASISVPAPLTPKCVLRSANGKTSFQPDETMPLELLVSGIATEARFPNSTAALTAPKNVITSQFKSISLLNKANRIGLINRKVYNWSVQAPRPLVAVDGSGTVTFVAHAYLTAVNNASPTAASCAFQFQVTAPATCKLWTDKATVLPGQCANITSATAGPVKPNSLVIWAEDPTGKAIGGVTQSGSNATFCAPAVSSYSTGYPVPKENKDVYAPEVAALNTNQKKALYETLKGLQDNLAALATGSNGGKIDADKAELLNFSINKFNDLFSLGDAQKAAMSKVNFDTFPYLKDLTSEQEAALRAMKEADLKPLDQMNPIDLSTVPLLDKGAVSDARLDKLSSYRSNALLSYIGEVLDDQAAREATPVDFKVRGKLQDFAGYENRCLVHVTAAGNNPCPFFGSQFPNYTQSQTATIIYEGSQSSYTFQFKPDKPNWEVDSIATSPFTVDPCPPSARCYAIDLGSNRTLFTTVHEASTATCNATTNMRLELGCFAGDTKVRMGDGSEKPIHALRDGDQVWNPLRKKAVAIRRITPGPERFPLWTLQTEHGQLRVTSKHPFLTEEGLKQTNELKVGDLIRTAQGSNKVVSINEAPSAPNEWVWNFELDTESKQPEDHAILADGVVSGDLFLQEQLAHSRMRDLSETRPE